MSNVLLHLFLITLQAVATYDLQFLDIFAGWPGVSHNARVFWQNPLYRTLPARLQTNAVNCLSETYHIVGDSAFPLSPQLLTPFRNRAQRPFNEVMKKYNTHLSSKRNVRSQSIFFENILAFICIKY